MYAFHLCLSKHTDLFPFFSRQLSGQNMWPTGTFWVLVAPVLITVISVEGRPTTTVPPQEVASEEDFVLPKSSHLATLLQQQQFLQPNKRRWLAKSEVLVQHTEKEYKTQAKTLSAWITKDARYQAQKRTGKSGSSSGSNAPPTAAPSPAKKKRHNRLMPPPKPRRRRRRKHNVRTVSRPGLRGAILPHAVGLYPMAAQQRCNRWLRKAATICSAASAPTEECTTHALAEAKRDESADSPACVMARAKCETYLR